MNEKLIAIFVIVVLSLIGVIGDWFIKLSGSGEKFIDLKWFFLGLIVYASTTIGWFYVMKHIKLATLGVFYGIFTILFLTVLGIVFFKETLSSLEIIGIIAGMTSIVLLGKFA